MRFLIFHIVFFSSLRLLAQNGSSELNINSLRVRLASNAYISDSMGVPAVRLSGGLGLMDGCGVWMSAMDSAGMLRTAAHSLLLNAHEFWSGPLQLQNETPSSQAAWDKVYPVSQKQIDEHIASFRNSGYQPLPAIASWPGSLGPPYAQVLAPFVDVELNDRVYEPLKGDYPYIASDAIVYSIANDRYSSLHSYSGGLPLGVELHASVFGFSGDSALEHCVLLRYSVYNRSSRDYKAFRFSPVINFAIGSLRNEFLGTEVGASAIYAINDSAEATFSGRLVSTGCMAINRRISSTMYFENTNDPINGRPDSAIHFFNLMQGRWKNGQKLNYGSNGVDGSGVADYVYPDTGDVSNGGLRWTDQAPGAKLGILNFDSIELKKSEAVNFEMVLFYVESNSYNLKQIGLKCLNIKKSLQARNLLKNPSLAAQNKPVLSAWPNPVKIGDKLRLGIAFESPCMFRLIDSEGRVIDNLDLDIKENSIILPPDLCSGVYVLEYETLNMVQQTKLIINP